MGLTSLWLGASSTAVEILILSPSRCDIPSSELNSTLDTSHPEGLGINGSPSIDGVKLTFSRVFLRKQFVFHPSQAESLCSQLHRALENPSLQKTAQCKDVKGSCEEDTAEKAGGQAPTKKSSYVVLRFPLVTGLRV